MDLPVEPGEDALVESQTGWLNRLVEASVGQHFREKSRIPPQANKILNKTALHSARTEGNPEYLRFFLV